MSDRLFVATRKGLFRFDRARSGWSITNRSFLGDPVYIVFPDARNGFVYAAITHGHFGTKLHRSADGGGLDYPGIHSICVDPRDSRRVCVGVSCGGVWVTHDGGAAWNCRADGMRADYMPPEQANDPGIQDPHCMVQSPSVPDTMWVQHHNGVFRTTDGAKSWHEIDTVKPSVFRFAVAVHPSDPDTAWTVPAIKDEIRISVDGKVVVARTRDGGKSIEVLRNGLPQSDAYDLTFRHALDIDETGERLAFGSTTGSVWASDNGGDDWFTVSVNLPPVYCVRFA